MSTLKQFRDGLSRAWDSVMEGWSELVDRAGEALTRFQPSRSDAEVESREDWIVQRASRWGVLAAEVKLTDDTVDVAIEVPGMDPADFEIRVVDDYLVVHGEKRVARERTEGRYHVMERAFGSFERAVRLPAPVDDSGSKARYDRGVLHITLPRTQAHRARRIEVSQA